MRPRAATGAVLLASGLAVSACAELELGAEAVKSGQRTETAEQTENDAAGTEAAGAETPVEIAAISPEAMMVEQDVEAPDAFSAGDLAIWDGRPTLGGIWVAHPTTTQPERVRITNESTDVTITGALFRRDAALSGPPIQVSSAAAAALGLEAGVPAELAIVAIRREMVPQETQTVAALPGGAVETETLPALEPTGEAEESADAADDAPVETEAVEATEVSGEESALDEPTTSEAPVEATAEVEDAPDTEEMERVAAILAALTEDEEPLEELAEEEAAPETEVAAAAPAEPAAATAETAPAETVPTPAAPVEDAAIETAAAQTAPAQIAPAQTAPVETAEAAPVDTPLSASAPDRPFIQVGTFSVADNASALADELRAAGLPAELRSSGTLTRVVVGPAGDDATLGRYLDDLRERGFDDAVAVGG
ncbi:MAG: SPOR domain-containing protein [Pseudomonadota bacterium]